MPFARDVSTLCPLPEFDLEGLVGGAHQRALCDACERLGAFVLRARPADAALRREALVASRRFFELDAGIKLRYHNAGAYRGYIPVQDDGWESFELGDVWGPIDPAYRFHHASIWPDEGLLPGWRAVMEQYASLTRVRTSEVLRVILGGLGDGGERLAHASETLRLLDYPGPTMSSDDIELDAHTDSGYLTAILQDAVGGLQLQDRSGRWLEVAPTPDTWVIFVGDMLALLSGGRFVAPVHRTVVRARRRRTSLAYFFEPSSGQYLAPLSDAGRGSAPMRYGDYLYAKIEGAFRGQYEGVIM